MKAKRLKELEKLSAHFDKEFSGDIENTEPLTKGEREWFKKVIQDTSPKVPVTIRLRRWQIERAKQMAKKKKLRGYQTLIDRILTEALI
ncbi:MAG: hypothetical protein A3G34_00900 [Candidatus Lindowbacteria bacterium RIFCSPLOWO2_12_FULL_62_27]|nr:MAG: hypothetical protein A3G34_00900 [Candidatus Lindowbacteria bacterium RIFCSPLOWO2_12_FULL_62_27]